MYSSCILRLGVLVTAIPLCSAFAMGQSSPDRYTVNQSGGTSTSPVQQQQNSQSQTLNSAPLPQWIANEQRNVDQLRGMLLQNWKAVDQLLWDIEFDAFKHIGELIVPPTTLVETMSYLINADDSYRAGNLEGQSQTPLKRLRPPQF